MLATIEGPEEIDEIVSVMMVGEGQGLESGGLGEEDRIEGNVDASSRAQACASPRFHCTYHLVVYNSTITWVIRVHPCSVPTPMFSPSLDSTVVVDVPSNARAGGLSLLFRARTGSASALEQLKRDGVKVTVPMPTGERTTLRRRRLPLLSSWTTPSCPSLSHLRQKTISSTSLTHCS